MVNLALDLSYRGRVAERVEKMRERREEREGYCREDKVFFSVFIFGVTCGEVRI